MSRPAQDTQHTVRLQSWYQEGLAAQIESLRASGETLRAGSSEGAASVRRMARALRGSGTAFGFPEVHEAAGAVETAERNELPERLERLLTVLQESVRRRTPDRVKILIVEDDPGTARLLQAALDRPNHEIFTAGTAAAAEAILAAQEVALIVLDLTLPDDDGRSLLLRLREVPATASIPVLVLSGKRGNRTRSECFALGADEFFEKPFDPELLAVAVSARLQRTAEISMAARRDPLTGLPNRAAFGEAFDRAKAVFLRTRRPLAVAILDLDRFKDINDAHGHPAGDDVLRRTSRAIADALRTSDTLARWGGEEFVALFPDTDPAGARSALEKALASVRTMEFAAPDGRTFRTTFSAGVADVGPAQTVEEAVGTADRVLYLAKARGRNRVLTVADRVEAPPTRVPLVMDDDPSVHSRHGGGREA